MNEENQKIGRLAGYDLAGEAFVSDGILYRGMYQGYGRIASDVLDKCQRGGLFDKGIVRTRALAENPFPEYPYEIVLEHEKIPFISYPHEWPASMLKDAAIFHAEVFLELSKQGLTCKDWHPYNILFNNTEPVFVDFPSIVPISALLNEPYLRNAMVGAPWSWLWSRYAVLLDHMFRIMCEPYMLLPMLMMTQSRHEAARVQLYHKALNTSATAISRHEVFGRDIDANYSRFIIKSRIALTRRDPLKKRYFEIQKEYAASLQVSPPPSAYVNYYKAKSEDYDLLPSPSWKRKQAVVHEYISKERPRTLLDVACNTGWYARMAARQGCQVVAFDIDESCAEKVYQDCKRDGASVLPLTVNFQAMRNEVAGLEYPEEPPKSLLGMSAPLLRSAEERFKCDMVLALAIIHHLVLGAGMNVQDVVQRLGRLSEKGLILEFVDVRDPLILGDPDFFPAYRKAQNEFDDYTLEGVEKALLKEYRHVVRHSLDEPTRTILFCTR